ncbi:MAG: hypothetical protein HY940_09765 [Gammaproteobacteria bacterium]|nr:hypothetical protein [Gammaproteobacteria bacterium]
MAVTETQVVLLRDSKGGEAEACLQLTRFEPRERLQRAVRMLGICWGLALAAVFVPIVHFILVPGFLVAGVVMAIRRYRQPTEPNGLHGQCPGCQRAVVLRLEAGETLPQWKYCPECNAGLQLLPARIQGTE